MSWHGIPIPTDGRDDWLAKRKTGIGASDVAGILGLSPWATPFTVWAAKTQDLEDAKTEAMHWGKRLEDVVVDEFEDRTGLSVHGRQWLVRHPDHPWVMSTIDGLAFEGPYTEPELDVDENDPFDPLGVVEVKTDAGFGAWADGPPDHVLCQVQWQMLTTGLAHAWVPVLHGGRRFEVYEVAYDEGLADKLLLRVGEWRERHIVGGEMPEPDESPATTRVIGDLWPQSIAGEAVELDRDAVADIEALAGWKREKAAAEKEVKRLENKIKAALADAEVGMFGGAPMVTWKTQHRDEYTVPANDYRVLRLSKQKETA